MKKKFLLSEAEGMVPLVRNILADVADAVYERADAERLLKRARHGDAVATAGLSVTGPSD